MLSDPSGPAEDLLAAVVARYGLDDIAQGEALPSRRWIGHGQPGQIAADEEQALNPKGSLVVSLGGITTTVGTGGTDDRARVAGYTTTHTASYVLRLMRPYPTVQGDTSPPAPAKVTAAALVCLRDSARLVDALHAWAGALPRELRVSLGQVEPVGPGGMLSGNRVTANLWPL